MRLCKSLARTFATKTRDRASLAASNHVARCDTITRRACKQHRRTREATSAAMRFPCEHFVMKPHIALHNRHTHSLRPPITANRVRAETKRFRAAAIGVRCIAIGVRTTTTRFRAAAFGCRAKTKRFRAAATGFRAEAIGFHFIATEATTTCQRAWLCKPDAPAASDVTNSADVAHAGKGWPPFPGTPSGMKPRRLAAAKPNQRDESRVVRTRLRWDTNKQRELHWPSCTANPGGRSRDQSA